MVQKYQGIIENYKSSPLGISDFFPLKAAEPMLYKTLICVGLKIDSQNLF